MFHVGGTRPSHFGQDGCIGCEVCVAGIRLDGLPILSGSAEIDLPECNFSREISRIASPIPGRTRVDDRRQQLEPAGVEPAVDVTRRLNAPPREEGGVALLQLAREMVRLQVIECAGAFFVWR